MPYLTQKRRQELLDGEPMENTGDLTFVLSATVERFLDELPGRLRYEDLAKPISALDNAKEEYRRQVLNPYEDRKMQENGYVHKPR
jgi:hypothetical protein